MREFNTYVNHDEVHLKAFLGVTARSVHHYIFGPSLTEENLDDKECVAKSLPDVWKNRAHKTISRRK